MNYPLAYHATPGIICRGGIVIKFFNLYFLALCGLRPIRCTSPQAMPEWWGRRRCAPHTAGASGPSSPWHSLVSGTPTGPQVIPCLLCQPDPLFHMDPGTSDHKLSTPGGDHGDEAKRGLDAMG
jgi:hypothetical protein